MPSTIDTGDVHNDIDGRERWIHCFYASGRYWVIYYIGGKHWFTSSVDAVNWETPTELFPWGYGCYELTSWFDGTYVHVAYGGGGSLRYRRGKPNPDGTITWDTTWQVIADGANMHPCVSVDSEGYPWIGYDVKINSDHYPYVIKSSRKDGTWDTESGFPVQLSTVSNPNFYLVRPCPLTGGKVYVAYASWNVSVLGKLWNGSSFESEETCSLHPLKYGANIVRSYKDDVYLLYKDRETNDIYLRKRTYGSGWGSEIFVANRTSNYGVVTATVVNDTLYIFICSEDGTKISLYTYYNGSLSGESDLFSGEDSIRWLYSFYNKIERYIGIMWVTGTSSPYSRRFGALAIPPASLKSGAHAL